MSRLHIDERHSEAESVVGYRLSASSPLLRLCSKLTHATVRDMVCQLPTTLISLYSVLTLISNYPTINLLLATSWSHFSLGN